MTYDNIRTVAFQLAPGAKLKQTVYTMALPEKWKNRIRQLCAQQNGRKPDETTLPIRSLNAALFAIIPDISISPFAGYSGNKQWLLSAKPIIPDAIRTIVLHWINARISDASPARRQRLIASLQTKDLVCKTDTINVAAWTTNEAGTAKEKSGLVYDVIPDLLARRIVELRDGIQIGDETLRFRRFPSPSGARVVSWPPLEFARPTKWFYSVHIDITTQTIPFSPHPQVFCHCGVTRWLSRPATRIYVESGKSTNAAILTESPLIESLPQSTSFMTAPASRRRVDDQWQTAWDDELPHILRQLNVQGRFPEPDDILAFPERCISGVDGVCAAFTYRTELPGKHSVESGLLVGDRQPIDESLSEIFAPDLIPVRSPQRCGKRRDLTIQENHTRAHLAATFKRKRLVIEIYWRTGQVRRMLEQQFRECLGSIQDDHEWEVEFRPTEQDGRFDLLDLEAANRNHPRAIGNRVQAFVDTLKRPPKKEVVATLVEIDDSRGERGNPKLAIRIGLSHTGRISQFIISDDDSLEHRARHACLDLLRQLGCRHSVLNLEEQLGVDAVNCVGFWMVNQYYNKRAAKERCLFPIAIYLSTDGMEPQAFIPGFDDWMTYPEALLAIAEGRYRNIKKDAVVPFVREVLNDFDGAGPTVVFAAAQNFRSYWTWLQNGRIELDRFSVGDARPLTTKERPDFRIVRLRTSDSRETPEFYAYDDERSGLSSGLFDVTDRVFYSAAGTPSSVKENRRTSKISSWQTRDGDIKEKQPGTRGWNPNLLEVTCAFLQPDDEPAKWAQLAHTLRDLSVQYDAQTALPLPLHLAKGMEEYIPPAYSASYFPVA